MLQIILSFLVAIRVFFRSRSDAALEIELLGPPFLDGTPPVLVPLDGRLGTRKTRNRGRLAPCRLPSLLALAIPAAGRTTEDHRRDSHSDPKIGAGEPGLGSAQDSR